MTAGTHEMIRAGVIGHPIAHSRSPVIHGYWLRKHGIAGRYERILVEPDRLESFIRGLGTQGLTGCNVTVPHKEGAASLCERLTPTARALGAANTLWFEKGVLHGDNTDVMGFTASLDEALPGWGAAVKTARLLGAGGAARAILYGLANKGVRRIEIANRGQDRAETMVSDLRPLIEALGTTLFVTDWAGRGDGLGEVDLVVNTTALGMHGQPPLDIDLAGLPAHAIVTDAVYVPLVTPLLAAARARGLVAVDGLGMLLHQARPGFERWFGVNPAVTPDLRRLVEADLAGA